MGAITMVVRGVRAGFAVAGAGAASVASQLALPAERASFQNGGGRASVKVGDRLVPLAEFLAYCARTLSTEPEVEGDSDSDELRRARDRFVRAGAEALEAQPASDAWLQVGIRPPEDPALRSELYRRTADLARSLLSERAVDNFFFMHKPPGMRLRFGREASGPRGLDEAVYEEVARWRTDGLIDGIEPGVYEPESQLFGGPASMKYVHALFTVDSLVWLDYHARPIPSAEEEDSDVAWLVSLAILPAVFEGLDITGWEDIGVWEHIREHAGRHLGQDATSLPGYAEIAKSVRAIWLRRDLLLEQLHPDLRSLVTGHYATLRIAASQWRSGYFSTGSASIGPRAAAAFYVVFHWNRAALSAVQQALLTESLSKPET
jgi:thiopeptide-type bacteriocin biosynthesis protein